MKKISLLTLFNLLFYFSTTFTQVVNVNGIIFNEVYYDATTNSGGQWNSSGTDDGTLEFIEFYNSGASTINIANWVVADANSFRFQFDGTTRNIGPGQSFLLTDEIGSYTPPSNHYVFDIDIEGTTSGSWGLSNTGDCLFLINTGLDNVIGGDDTWITFRYADVANSSTTDGPQTPSGADNGTEVTALDVSDQSLNRNPDITGTSWLGHLSLNALLACSPNRKTDGTTPLPVELSFFTVSTKGKVVNLIWTTKTEVNNYGFEIERASSLTSPIQVWERIGFVAGAGNSNSPKDYSFSDSKTLGYGQYRYRLKQLDSDGKYEYSKEVEVDFGSVKDFSLHQNYPNPFNPSTFISYSIPQAVHVKLSVFNVLGSEIAILVDEFQEAGFYSKEFSIAQNGLNLTNGVYFYKLEAGNFTSTKKFILMK